MANVGGITPAITSSVTAATTPPPASASATVANAVDKKTIAGNFDTFLKLLTTQLKNQNPLEPLDTNQFTQQLVQFAQVEQQIKQNDQLATLVSIEKAAQSTTALAYVGATVAVDGQTAASRAGRPGPSRRRSRRMPPSLSRAPPARPSTAPIWGSMRGLSRSSGMGATRAARYGPTATIRSRSPARTPAGSRSPSRVRWRGWSILSTCRRRRPCFRSAARASPSTRSSAWCGRAEVIGGPGSEVSGACPDLISAHRPLISDLLSLIVPPAHRARPGRASRLRTACAESEIGSPRPPPRRYSRC
jgi:hypothetical protein